jgi:dihydrofolate synthase/folylpolyglutamate synthase
LGPHQLENAATAYAALKTAHQRGLQVEPGAIQQGFGRAQWPGRFEVLQREPPVVVDAAHTPGAMVKVRQTLDEFFPQRQLWLVLGVSEDKDITGMLAELAPKVRRIYCAKAPHPRAMEAQVLADKVAGFGKPVQAFEDVGAALESALAEADPEGVVLVTGSVFIAASGRIAWFQRVQTEM